MTLIVFAHLGTAPYLPSTLEIARTSNPSAECVLIGDDSNQAVAEETGWRHFNREAIVGPELERFQACFDLIALPSYRAMERIFEVTRFVFERYWYSAQVARSLERQSYWMFDSDEIILEDLQPFEMMLQRDGQQCTRMSRNTSIRGLMDVDVSLDFFEFATGLFEDDAFVQQKTLDIESGEGGTAFTEMAAGAMMDVRDRGGAHLAEACEGWHFDDCITHPEGFRTTELGHFSKLVVKDVDFDGRSFTGVRRGQKVKFATINGSGLPRQIFPWFLDCLMAREAGKLQKSNILAYQPSFAWEMAWIARSKAKGLMAQLARASRKTEGKPAGFSARSSSE